MRVCNLPGCNLKHYGRGYCHKHYKRFMAHGDPLKRLNRKLTVCKVNNEDCTQGSVIKRGYCTKHYERFAKYGDPNKTLLVVGSHGMSGTDEHNIWKEMKRRCKPNHPRRKDYYDRGIYVCDRWLGKDGFQNFYNDLGPRPSKEHSIDRINNDGIYENENCMWSTHAQQNSNTRKVKEIWCHQTGEVFNSQVEAGRNLNVYGSHVCLNLKGKVKKAKRLFLRIC